MQFQRIDISEGTDIRKSKKIKRMYDLSLLVF